MEALKEIAKQAQPMSSPAKESEPTAVLKAASYLVLTTAQRFDATYEAKGDLRDSFTLIPS
eukprot:8406312-Prorocentrum_lima.AAC.1